MRAFILALALLIPSTASAGKYTSRIACETAAVTMQETVQKVARSKCPQCKGTGRVTAGDGVTIVTRECDNCYDDGGVAPPAPEPTPKPQPTPPAPKCNNPNCKCDPCRCNTGRACILPQTIAKGIGAQLASVQQQIDLTYEQLAAFVRQYSVGRILNADVDPRQRVWQHLTSEHGFTPEQVNRLTLDEALWLHAAAHDNHCTRTEIKWAAPAERKRRALYFTADYCGICKTQIGDLKPWDETGTREAPLTRLLAAGWKVSDQPDAHFQIVDAENSELDEKYGVDRYPTIVLIEDDVEVGRHVGAVGSGYTAAEWLTRFYTGAQ